MGSQGPEIYFDIFPEVTRCILQPLISLTVKDFFSVKQNRIFSLAKGKKKESLAFSVERGLCTRCDESIATAYM